MQITRYGYPFEVVDDNATHAEGFWLDKYASGIWKPETLDAIERILTSESTYVDIESWVGPTVLWASLFCDQVVAVEPDPVALKSLKTNVEQNTAEHTAEVSIVNAAVGQRNGTDTLYIQGSLGNSMSSMKPVGAPALDVETITFESLIQGLDNIDLVKIDVEGGEDQILWHSMSTLINLRCPIIMGLHFPWVLTAEGLRQNINSMGNVTYLDNHPDFPTVLIEPR